PDARHDTQCSWCVTRRYSHRRKATNLTLLLVQVCGNIGPTRPPVCCIEHRPGHTSTIGSSHDSLSEQWGVCMYQTNQYEGMLSETVIIRGANNDIINAYLAKPLGPGPYPGMVLIHHLPGWDEWYREATRKFAHHGFVTISPNLYYRDGHGTPEVFAHKVRAAGGGPGGAQTPIGASYLNFDAAIDCWGGRVVMAQSELNPKNPVAPIDMTKD